MTFGKIYDILFFGNAYYISDNNIIECTENEKVDGSKVIATVGTEKITQAEFDAMLLALRRQGRDFSDERGRETILDELISQKLFLLDARKNLYEFNPEFKAEMQRVKEEMLVSYAMNKSFESIKVTDTEAKEFYDENKDRLGNGETVNASHILVSEEAEIMRIREEIVSGAITFEDAAKKYSTCPSKEDGGNLGDFGRGQMVPEFEDAAFAMEPGQISEPVKTQFGYHLIKLNSKGTASTPDFDTIKDNIKEHLLREKRQKAFRSKVNQLKILYPVTKA